MVRLVRRDSPRYRHRETAITTPGERNLFASETSPRDRDDAFEIILRDLASCMYGSGGRGCTASGGFADGSRSGAR